MSRNAKAIVDTVATETTVSASDVENVMVEEKVARRTEKEPAPKKAKPLPMDTYVPCVSMIKTGRLYYQSKRQMGYTVVWHNFMDEQYLELSELMAMKSSDPTFFTENWIVIPDSFELKEQVLDALRVRQYYVGSIDPYALNDLFTISIPEMEERISYMSDSVRASLREYVKDSMKDGTLDSLKRVRALETALNCKFN